MAINFFGKTNAVTLGQNFCSLMQHVIASFVYHFSHEHLRESVYVCNCAF